MKRTGEIVLSVIGIILSVIGALVGMFFLWASNLDEARTEALNQIENDPALAGESVDIDAIMDLMSAGSWAIIIAALIGIIVGILGIIFVKGNNKPKVAGLVLIIGGIVVGVLSMGSGLLATLLFLIAGIMCFARKPADMNQNSITV